LYFFVKIQKKQKNKYDCNFSKIRNTKKYESKISNIQNAKKIRTQNFKNTNYKENTNSKMSQRANPMFTLEIRKQIAKEKKQIQPVSFSKPCSSDFVFLNCFFFVFFGNFEIWTEDPSVANPDYSNIALMRRPVATESTVGPLHRMFLLVIKIHDQQASRCANGALWQSIS